MTGIKKSKKQYSKEFKEETVKMIVEGRRTVASVSRELGISTIFYTNGKPIILRIRKTPIPAKVI